MEQALTLIDRAFPFTAVCVLRLGNGPSPEALRNALLRLQQLHPAMRVFIDGQTFVESPHCPPVPLEVKERLHETHWQEVARAWLNRSVPLGQAPLLRAIYLRAPGQANAELVMAFHHAIADAASLIEWLHQLLQLSAGQTPSLDPYPLLPGAESLFPKSWKGLGLLRRLPGFLGRQFREERLYKRENRQLQPSPIPSGATNRLEFVSLGEEETKLLIRQSRKAGVTVAGLLSAAMLRATVEARYQNQRGAYRTIQFAGLRSYLQPAVPPDKLGCYISMLRFTEVVSPDDSLSNLARRLSRQVYDAGKRGDRFMAAFLSKLLVKATLRLASQRLGVTALSYAGPVVLRPRYGPVSVRGIHGFISNNPLGAEFTAFGKTFNKCLELDIQYLEEDMNPEEAREIALRVKALLTNPSGI
jgi:hypothetical protein